MTTDYLKSMSADELWILYEEITSTLAGKMARKKVKLEQRLHELDITAKRMSDCRRRRFYPPVLPKYHNPENLIETWSGRGKTPRWLKAQLAAGNSLENFLVDRPLAKEQVRYIGFRSSR